MPTHIPVRQDLEGSWEKWNVSAMVLELNYEKPGELLIVFQLFLQVSHDSFICNIGVASGLCFFRCLAKPILQLLSCFQDFASHEETVHY